MGNAQAKNNPKKDRQALTEFLKGKANLDKIWKRFDKDGNVEYYAFAFLRVMLCAVLRVATTELMEK